MLIEYLKVITSIPTNTMAIQGKSKKYIKINKNKRKSMKTCTAIIILKKIVILTKFKYIYILQSNVDQTKKKKK